MIRVLIAISLLMCLVPAGYASADADSDTSGTSLLLDHGDGHTEWFPIDTSGTIASALDSALSGRITYAYEGGTRIVESVDGVAKVTIGTGVNRQDCGWRLYSWNTVEWEFLTTDVSDRYNGYLALAYYPNDTIRPVATPDYAEIWTSFRGDSSASGISGSTGPEFVATPIEWSNTYPGAVDCSILYADGMIYHTVAGKYGSVGMDSYARICCLDPVNQEVLWAVNYSTSSTETVTPLILSDLILVASSNWHIYCLDRYTGEAVAELCPNNADPDMCQGSKVTTYIPRKADPSVSNDRVHLEGGVTNMVYDSGALYFGTSDGLLRCYSIDREKGFREIWVNTPASTSDPETTYRGCFYYSSPAVTDIGGVRCVLAGNYHGALLCVNASTGAQVWSANIHYKDSGERAGNVASVNICSGERALITYTGGNDLDSSVGGVALIDLADGSIVWQQDIRCVRPVVSGDRFYCYVSATGSVSAVDSTTHQPVELESGYYSFWVDDGSFLWCQDTDVLSTGGMTYCDGKVYSMDYSPGTEGANGGWVWCMDCDTGRVVWKAKVTPYSGSSYSMCAPTVVDGMVLVGNDYGAVYLLSEKSGDGPSRSSAIEYMSEGLGHWSWIALAISSIIVLAVAVRIYRK